MCGIDQLSPGAYLLRGDLFPTIISVSEHRLFVLVELIAYLGDQGTGDGEVYIRSAAFAYTLV